MSGKKRILIATNKFDRGGVETTLLTLLNNYSINEYEITLALCCAGGELESLIPSHVKIIYLVPFDPMKLPRTLSRIYQLLILLIPNWLSNALFIKEQYDSVISYSGNMIYYVKGFNGNKTCWIHDDWFPFKTQSHVVGLLRKRITLSILSSCKNVICVSATLRKMLLEYSANKLKNVIFLPNPIDTELIRRCGLEDCDYVFQKKKLYFVSVGRLHPVKGYNRLINIFIHLHDEYPDIVLLIIGEGDERSTLENTIKEYKAEEYIKLLGFQNNPHKYVSRCSMFICSSFMEGYGTAISEAMILGNAIISTNCGGSDQILEDGKYGILTENTTDGLENGIRKVLENRDLISYYRKQSLLQSEKLFDLHRAVNDIQRIAFVCEGAYRGGREDSH